MCIHIGTLNHTEIHFTNSCMWCIGCWCCSIENQWFSCPHKTQLPTSTSTLKSSEPIWGIDQPWNWGEFFVDVGLPLDYAQQRNPWTFYVLVTHQDQKSGGRNHFHWLHPPAVIWTSRQDEERELGLARHTIFFYFYCCYWYS